MDPTIWGPPMWFVMHSITFNYPEKPTAVERRIHRDFFHNIAHVLPCSVCRNHFEHVLREYPIEPHLDTRASLVQWLVDVHNIANERDGKPRLPIDVVLSQYMRVYAEGKTSCDLNANPAAHRPASQTPSSASSVGDPSSQSRLPSSLKHHWKWLLLSLLLGVLLIVVIGAASHYVAFSYRGSGSGSVQT